MNKNADKVTDKKLINADEITCVDSGKDMDIAVSSDENVNRGAGNGVGMNADSVQNEDNALDIEDFYDKLIKLRMKQGVGLENMGCKIVGLGPGRATMEMEIEDIHMNPIGSVHGGMIFFLADSAGGTAAFTRGSIAVTSNGGIHFVNAAMNVKKLVAEAVEIKAGKNLLTYDVTIRTVEGKVIAKATMEYSSLHIPIE
ncbi:MAG: PaaI family thioesterase [Clostridiales bacterium]|nr:PaaI family thioesterase [Clostridiales bacterium]